MHLIGKPKGVFNFDAPFTGKDLILNREISWLEFNERVLQEAENPEVPLLERIKFLAICSSNLDEFFRVRVAAQQRLMELKPRERRAILFDPEEVLERIQQSVIRMQSRLEQVFYKEIKPDLAAEQVFLHHPEQIPAAWLPKLTELFSLKVLPFLTPLMISKAHHAVPLKDAFLYLAIRMKSVNQAGASPEYALIELPTRVLPRFWEISFNEDASAHHIFFLDDLIRIGLPILFSSLGLRVTGAYTIKLTRDQELDLEGEEGGDLAERMSRSLKNRKRGDPVRFIYDSAMPLDMLQFLVRHLSVGKSNLIPGGTYHNFSQFSDFPELNRPDLRYPAPLSVPCPELDGEGLLFDVIRGADQLLHHPYQSYDYVLRFLREAAIDPQVRSIRITLYRVARISSVVNSLITAAMNGKKVTAVIEIQARFDEENNLYWAERLKDAGARVIFGELGTKIHAKVCLVTRVEHGRPVRYAHMATGNYNRQTARLYADDGLLTANKSLTAEVFRLFKLIENPNESFIFRRLLVAPEHMRKQFEALIFDEMQRARSGKVGFMMLKMNSLTDERMIRLLYEASRSGVEIRLIIRGMCSLIPGVPGMSERIEVISIVDRFLEHSRIYWFGHGGRDQIYLSSADWMNRNLSRRIEMAFPIINPRQKQRLKKMLLLQWSDNVKSRRLNAVEPPFYDRPLVRAQFEMFDLLRSEMIDRIREAH
jgi:polyphosphate kinase